MIMRKYQQLILILTSITSVLLLLIYRHEYLRLHYVLEVLNFFGTPSKKIEVTPVDFKDDWGPIPAWQQITDDVYVYSAHKENGEVKILGIASNKFNNKMICNLWYENNPKPSLGKFSYVVLTQGTTYTNYLYICKLKHLQERPYAVSLMKSNKILIRETRTPTKVYDLTVCVTPSETNVNASSIIDFTSFNQVVGADNFIFYSNSIPYSLLSSLRRVAPSLNFGFTSLLWNVPSVEVKSVSELIMHDCLMRTKAQSKFVIILTLNEYVIPKLSTSLMTLLETVDQAERFTLSVVKFCLSLMPPKFMIQNIRYIQPLNEEVEEFNIYVNVRHNDTELPGSRSLDTDAVMLYKYVHCPEQETFSDSAGLKFINHINNAQLRIMYETGEL